MGLVKLCMRTLPTFNSYVFFGNWTKMVLLMVRFSVPLTKNPSIVVVTIVGAAQSRFFSGRFVIFSRILINTATTKRYTFPWSHFKPRYDSFQHYFFYNPKTRSVWARWVQCFWRIFLSHSKKKFLAKYFTRISNVNIPFYTTKLLTNYLRKTLPNFAPFFSMSHHIRLLQRNHLTKLPVFFSLCTFSVPVEGNWDQMR